MRFAPWVVLIFGGVVLALLGVAFVPSLVREHHGHMHHLLEVTVRVVDRQTGEPLEGALLFTVATPNFFEMGDFELLLDELVRLLDRDPEESWAYGWICAGRTGARAETTIHSAVYVTSYWRGPFRTRKNIHVPEILLVEHPRYGRVRVPIDPALPLEEGDAPDTWRVDLGTVRVPR